MTLPDPSRPTDDELAAMKARSESLAWDSDLAVWNDRRALLVEVDALRAENEQLTVALGRATEEAVGWRAVAHNRSVTDIIADRDRVRALLDPDNEEGQRLIRTAINDPGQFTPRGGDYQEPIGSWGARAVALALRDAANGEG